MVIFNPFRWLRARRSGITPVLTRKELRRLVRENKKLDKAIEVKELHSLKATLDRGMPTYAATLAQWISNDIAGSRNEHLIHWPSIPFDRFDHEKFGWVFIRAIEPYFPGIRFRQQMYADSRYTAGVVLTW